MAFTSYSDKRGALRGVARHLGNAAEGQDLETLVQVIDGKWGFDSIAVDDAVFGNDATEEDENLILMCGLTHCPHCEIHLGNGISDFEGMVDRHGSEREALKHQKHEWMCLGCNGEFGKAIDLKGSKARGEPTRHYTNKSTIENAVQFCHDLFAGLPEETRRKDAIQAAVDKGIAFYTARTQYQKWHKARRTK